MGRKSHAARNAMITARRGGNSANSASTNGIQPKSVRGTRKPMKVFCLCRDDACVVLFRKSGGRRRRGSCPCNGAAQRRLEFVRRVVPTISGDRRVRRVG